MFEQVRERALHYALLLMVGGALFLPNLGGPSLWDIDEGNNAEAAREMFEAENWRLPTFNYRLRVDKPALLYWLQIFAYRTFGIGEFGARLPSALAGLVTLFLTYELGRQMFGAGAGLVGGIILATALMFCAAAHFANPDALLTVCTCLTFLVFWHGYERRLHFATLGVCTGLAVLAKGPVGLVLPTAVMGLFLLWNGQLGKLKVGGLAAGCFAFCVVALPWYLWVGSETHFEFLRGFIGTHNVGRFLKPMEGHGGPIYYYLVVLALGFAPWSAFLGPMYWHAGQGESDRPKVLAPRFLLCWTFCYVAFFSISSTKLPNYVLPVYPALAILTGRFLDDWRRGMVAVPMWCLYASLCCFALVGIGAAVGFAVAGGAVGIATVPARRVLPGLQMWSWLGLVPVGGAILAGWYVRRQWRTAFVVAVVLTAGIFIAPLAAWGGSALDAFKAPRSLAQAIVKHQVEPEIRIGCLAYMQPSLVFYCQREVATLVDEREAVEFLRSPLQVFLVTPAERWPGIEGQLDGPYTVLATRRDLYRALDVVLITNR